MGYTLSRSIRQFDRINLGREYPYKFDRPHDLSVVSSYKLDEGTTLSLTWVYGSGNTITLPKEQYLLVSIGDTQQYYEYGERNSYRMCLSSFRFWCEFCRSKSNGGNVHGQFLFITYTIDIIHFLFILKILLIIMLNILKPNKSACFNNSYREVWV